MSDFETWWAAYPRKVGKYAAQKAYEKARRTATAAALLDGIDTYREAKPTYADFCHPTTWLNQGRWLDEPDVSEPMQSETSKFNQAAGSQAIRLIRAADQRRRA